MFSIWSFIRSALWKGIGLISTDFCFGPFSFIESSGEYHSNSLCTCVLYFLCCIFCVVLKSLHYLRQLLLPSVWRIFDQTLNNNNKSQIWSTNTDSWTCDLPVCISKISECKQVELSATFLADFVHLLVFINDTFLLGFQLHFISVVTKSWYWFTCPSKHLLPFICFI